MKYFELKTYQDEAENVIQGRQLCEGLSGVACREEVGPPAFEAAAVCPMQVVEVAGLVVVRPFDPAVPGGAVVRAEFRFEVPRSSPAEAFLAFPAAFEAAKLKAAEDVRTQIAAARQHVQAAPLGLRVHRADGKN